jgi:hypothetical protein
MQSLAPGQGPQCSELPGTAVPPAAWPTTAASRLGQLCKEQIAHMAKVGLPSESQIQEAALAKAAEMGDADVAQLLMAWYYAGYYTAAKRAANTSTDC